jgi:hypothetical protein
MAPTRTRTRRAADVWLDDNLWAEPDRSREIELDAPPAPADAPDDAVRRDDDGVGVPAFYDHEVETTDRRRDGGEHVRRRASASAHPPRRLSGPRAVDPGARAAAPGAVDPAAAVAASEPAPVEPAGAPAAEDGSVPGLLRRPLVEVQRTLPTAESRRESLSRPDRVAMWAVGLAVVTLLAAILTASGSS